MPWDVVSIFPTTILFVFLLTDYHCSLAWAEMYLVLAALVQIFNFQFEDSKAEDFECESDQFTIGTKGKGLLKAHISILKG